MKTETDKKSILSGGRATGAGQMAVRDLLDVTWRMTVPTVIGIAIGYGLGTLAGNRTIGFLVGAVIGFSAGVYMAFRLLKNVSESES